MAVEQQSALLTRMVLLIQRLQHVVRPLFSAPPSRLRVADGVLRPLVGQIRRCGAEGHHPRGIFTKMGDRCYLSRPGTPAVPSICFLADLRRSKRRARPSIRSRRQLTSLMMPLASFCSDPRAFFGQRCLLLNAQPNDTGLLGARAEALLASASDPAARCSSSHQIRVAH